MSFLFSILQGITFDDLITLPGEIEFGVADVDLNSRVSRNYSLKTPLCSAPMDTVTEHEMAIGMALNGGMGFIHSKCTVAEQVAMVRKVKSYENGFILEPVVLSPENTLADLNEIRQVKKIKGVPVTEDGKMGSRLVGIVSNRDTDFVSDSSAKIKDLMTPADRLITARFPITIEEANRALKVSRAAFIFDRHIIYTFLIAGKQKGLPADRRRIRKFVRVDYADGYEKEEGLPAVLQGFHGPPRRWRIGPREPAVWSRR